MSSCGDSGYGFLPADHARIKSRDDWAIYCEIQTIQNAILTAISNCQYSAEVSGGSIMTSINGIQSVEVTSGGANYYPVVASATISHPTGTGAQVDPVIVGGIIQGFDVISSGTGYDPIVLQVDASGLGNGDAVIQAVVYEGSIAQVNIISSGSGYTAGVNLPLVHPVGTGGVLEISQVGGGGNILGVRIVAPGENYDTIFATLSVDHPTGVGFAGTVEVGSSGVTGITVQNGGVAYNDLLPTVSAIDSMGMGFTATPTVVNGVVTAVTVDNTGYSYTESANIVITPAPTSIGYGATAVVSEFTGSSTSCCTTGNCPTYPSTEYYAVWQGTEDNAMISDQLDSVKSYFTKLGYSIKLSTNPSTGSTLRWTITW